MNEDDKKEYIISSSSDSTSDSGTPTSSGVSDSIISNTDTGTIIIDDKLSSGSYKEFKGILDDTTTGGVIHEKIMTGVPVWDEKWEGESESTFEVKDPYEYNMLDVMYLTNKKIDSYFLATKEPLADKIVWMVLDRDNGYDYFSTHLPEGETSPYKYEFAIKKEDTDELMYNLKNTWFVIDSVAGLYKLWSYYKYIVSEVCGKLRYIESLENDLHEHQESLWNSVDLKSWPTAFEKYDLKLMVKFRIEYVAYKIGDDIPGKLTLLYNSLIGNHNLKDWIDNYVRKFNKNDKVVKIK